MAESSFSQVTIAYHEFGIDQEGWTFPGTYSGRNFNANSCTAFGALYTYYDYDLDTRASVTSPDYNLTSYTDVEISFCHVNSTNQEDGDGFDIQYYDGSSWSTIATFRRGTDFFGGGVQTQLSATINSGSYTFASNSAFRFIGQNNSTNEWNVYDDISIKTSGTCAPINTFPYSEGFESGLGAWTQDTGDNKDWLRNTGGTTSGGTGPSAASEGSWYMFTEGSSPNFNSEFNLISNCIDLTGSHTSATFSFYYHMYGTNMGTLDVEVSTNGGTTWSSPILTLSGEQQTSNGEAWRQGTASLTPYIGQTIRIRFNGVTGGDFTSDMAIDDISITTVSSGPNLSVVDSGSNIISDGGGNSPSLTNSTDFGNILITNSSAETYTLQNTGTSNLNITSIVSDNATDFAVSGITLPATITAGSSTTFTVTYTANNAGASSAVITINSNSNAPGNIYDFNTQGFGVTPFCSSTTVTLPYSESFETGLNGWSSGGSDALLANNAARSYDNDYSLNIRSNSGNGSSFCSPIMNLSSYDKVDFEFFFTAINFEQDELFHVDYSSDDGASWTTVRTFEAGDVEGASPVRGDFDINDTVIFYSKTVTILATDYTMGTNSRFRIRSEASDTTDLVYIDDVNITGMNYSTPTLGPGGITGNLELWLKADQLDGSNVGTDGSLVSSWIDNGRGHDAKTEGPGLEPIYRNSAARNINFNPVIDFENDHTTAGSDMTYIDTRDKVLHSTSGFNSNDIFIVAIPDPAVSSAILPLDTFTSTDPTGDTFSEDVTGFGYGNYSQRFTGEQFGYAIGTSNSAGNGYGRGTTNADINFNQVHIINTRHNATDTDIEVYMNANQVGDVTSDISDFAPVNNTRYWLGRSQYFQGSFDGRIAEVITYNARKNDANATQERNRIQSYLAIKYGITLQPTITAGVIEEGNLDYVDSDGSVIWDVSANSGYNFDIAGIGRDDVSVLDQRQSSSVNSIVDGTGETRGIVTMGLTSIETTNSGNKTVNSTSSFTDKNFIVWGNNNASLDAAPSTVAVDMSDNITGLNTNVQFIGMQRIWKVVETGDVSRVQISIPENAVRNITPPGNYLMFISETGVFTPTAQYRVMSSDGSGNLLAEYDFPANSERFITFGYAPEIIVERSINFDASAQNYIDVEDNLDLDEDSDDTVAPGASVFTISTWIKRESGSTNTSIVSKRDVAYTEGYDLKINSLNRVEMNWINGSTRTIQSSVAIPENEWHHIAVTHDGTTARLYIDGVLETTETLPLPLDTNRSFLIGAAGRDGSATAYFDGNIDEVRVWNAALTESQLRFLMNQELEDNAGTIGKYFDDNSILPSKNDASGLDFTNLRAYFPMSRYTYTNTNDDSGNDLIGYLRQLRTVDFQTAPLPYISTQNGNWTDATTWTNGSMQTIPGARALADNEMYVDWNIVETNHNITIDNTSLVDDTVVNAPDPDGNDNEGNRTVLAHVLSSGTVTVDGDNVAKTGFGYTVTHYLEMNGKLDLEGESQLIQTTDSDLILGPSGELEKDQQGVTNTYHYNYWSAPVGETSIDPTNTVNEHRYSYSVTDIMLDNGTAVNFSNAGYNGAPGSPVTIADYWIWKFANNTDGDYSQWEHVRRTGAIEPGEGFTMKGPGTTGTEQNYTFLGKPNNADINLTINQYNDYLVGNPYASAIDARQFIIDNGPTLYYEDGVTPEADATTSGTLYFWEHWGGSDHILANYQGGYATYNLAGSLAAPFSLTGTSDPDVSSTGSGTKAPGRYIPVGQGFFVVAANGGNINFNNGQRIFKKESIANGVTFRSNNQEAETSSNEITDEIDTRHKVKLGFDSVSGQHRQLLLTIDENTTPGVDWGYDAKTYEFKNDDMFWAIENDFYVIQSSDLTSENNSFPLIVYTSEDGNNTIKIDELINFEEEQYIYVHDKELSFYHDLRQGDYEIFLSAGYYDTRFEIVFSERNMNQSLGTDDDILNNEKLDVRYANSIDKVILINPHALDVKDIQIFNLLGQHVVAIEDIKTGNMTEYNVGNLSSGAYIIKLNTVSGSVSKKVLVD
ncbi:hypothetical protein GCM10011444_26670 [Winogradskyella haliclonae]|uniref:MAM domain-containing protein n=1 Tax=Winogradskyella haliclonae TaxID=2048558 RepID=A0ABQ2C5J8_9FLAO|nr:hypothetical protein GCM10011444_26670 [Winogradskyella haliclonae]